MSIYRSNFADYINKFVNYRKASGSWNVHSYGLNIKLFDHYCADNFPDQDLSQEMVDSWCKKRDTENKRSCYSRTQIIRVFIDYLKSRNLTEVSPAIPPIPERKKYIPHAFSKEELIRFFDECDNIVPYLGRFPSVLRKIQIPVFFRLLYSSGIRTTEARYLQCDDVDLEDGILNIRKSKGYDQHYVALHESMKKILIEYDETISQLQVDRKYFFESKNGGFHSRYWVADNFRDLWIKANGNETRVVPYDLRHNYAIENINSWEDDTFTFSDKLHYLSKSMGHRWIESTLYYYSIVPRLANTLQEKTESGFNEIVPEVAYEEE
ncbi:MAG: tyrosine-type recombinase/integrase [Clostridiales bacterium]|nr:tyrosine-type recombinase/integrase [Clostridiales bacterium]